MRSKASIRLIELGNRFEHLIAKVDIHHSLLWNINKFLGKNLSSEELDNWANKNASQIGDRFSNRWTLVDYETPPYMVWGHRFVDKNGENTFKQYRIYKQANDPDDMEIETSSFLQGDGQIPNLWMCSGVLAPDTGLQHLSAEFAHYGFVIDAILHLFFVSTKEESFMADLTSFIRNSKSALDKIRSMMSFHPRVIGSATAGVAYLIADNMVLKIFRDKISYEKALQAMERLHIDPQTAKTEAMIYDAGQLGQFRGDNLYYYVMEKMKPVNTLDKSHQSFIRKMVRTIGRGVLTLVDQKGKPDKDKLIRISQRITKEILFNYQDLVSKLTQDLNLKSNWLPVLVEEIVQKYLTGRGDLHIGNLGITNQGELRYYDPTHIDWQSELNWGEESDAR